MEQHMRIAEMLTELLDRQFGVGKFKFGLDPILGFIPWVGDVVTFVLSAYLIWIAYMMHMPQDKLAIMIRNVIFDFILGLIPVVGDISDFVYQANSKNFRILKEHANSFVEGHVVTSSA